MERAAVFEAIDAERAHQDQCWGRLSERPQDLGRWLTLMQIYLLRAQEAHGYAHGQGNALEALRKVLALGVACSEQHGLPARPCLRSTTAGNPPGTGLQRAPTGA